MYLDESRLNGWSVAVTAHAKQRLYDRFPELCAITSGLASTIVSMVKMGVVTDVTDTQGCSCICVEFGGVGLIVRVRDSNLVVVTLVNNQLWKLTGRSKKIARAEAKKRKKRVISFIGLQKEQ